MKWFVYIAFCIFVPASFSQEQLSLQRCLDLAQSNSLHISSESIKLRTSRLNQQFHWWSLLPDLSADAALNTSFGRRLDPFTNTFATSSVNSNSFGLNSGIRLFNGFHYFYKRNEFDKLVQLDELALHAKWNELKRAVTETYLALCQLSVQVRFAESRIGYFEEIRAIQRLLIREGRITVIDTLRSHNSLLVEHGLLLDLKQELKLKKLELSFQAGLPLGSAYEVDVHSISEVEEKLHFPEMDQAERDVLEKEVLAEQLKSARTKNLPSVSFNALLGTGFSTNNKDYLLAGNPTKPYRDQISQNLYESIGIYVSIPLFNRGEWLKTRQLNLLEQERLENDRQLNGLSLEKRRLELDLQRLSMRVKLEQGMRIADNLRVIYETSVLLYREGRLTYTETEAALMEWQAKQLETDLLKLDNEVLFLME